MTRGAQNVIVNAIGCEFDPHSRKLNIFLKFIEASILLCRGKARRCVLLLNTQCFRNSAESGERSSAETLGYSVKHICKNITDTILSIFVKLL